MHTRTPPVRLGFFDTYLSASCASLSSTHSYFKPYSYKEACTDPNCIKAMEDELTTINKTSTWELIMLPTGKTLIGCKWVYRVKTNFDESLKRNKAKLVAKGF